MLLGNLSGVMSRSNLCSTVADWWGVPSHSIGVFKARIFASKHDYHHPGIERFKRMVIQMLLGSPVRYAAFLQVIDFEYSGYNPRAFDIANHFCEVRQLEAGECRLAGCGLPCSVFERFCILHPLFAHLCQ